MKSKIKRVSSATQSCPTSCNPTDCRISGLSLSVTNSQNLLKLMSIESVIPSNHLTLCRPLLLLPQSFPVSGSFPRTQFFASGGQNIGASVSAQSGLISFRMDWLDLLAVQGILKSLLQHHSSKVSILWGSAFFMVQLSHPYMITGKTIALTRQTFASKVLSLLFNMLFRLVKVFLPRSKYLLISFHGCCHHLQ